MSNTNIVKSFTINGDPETIFEITKNILPVLNFTIQTSQKPVLIVAKRGSNIASWVSSHIEKVLTILRISFSVTQNMIQIVGEYDIKYHGILLQSDRDYIDNEFEQLKNNIFATIQHSQSIQDPHRIQPQPSVNIHIGKVGDDISSIKDSVVQHSDIGGKVNVTEPKSFRICPYCGQDLKLSKTPKLCPFCSEKFS